MPAADVDVDARLVRLLLAEQHPDLVGLPLAIAAEGWDNVVYRLGADLAVRVPRRAEAATLVLEEQKVLPKLAARLPVAIPAPIRIGTPGPLHPYSWSVVRWFDGRTATAEDMGNERLALEVAAFLRALHEPDDSPPVSAVRGVPLAERDHDVLRGRLASGILARSDELEAIWVDALRSPVHPGPPVRIHGDLHGSNMIVRDGILAGVIDFGDTTTGDPATDVAVAWLAFDSIRRHVLLEAIEADPALVRRARGWALVIGSAIVTMSEPGSAMVDVGKRALAEVLTD